MYPDGNQGWCLTWEAGFCVRPRGKSSACPGSPGMWGVKLRAPEIWDRLRLCSNTSGNNLDQPLRLSDLAEAAGLSPYQVSQRLEGLLGLTSEAIHQTLPNRGRLVMHWKRARKVSARLPWRVALVIKVPLPGNFGQTVGMTPKVYRDRALGSR